MLEDCAACGTRFAVGLDRCPQCGTPAGDAVEAAVSDDEGKEVQEDA